MDKLGILMEAIEFYSFASQAEKVYGPYPKANGRLIVVVIDEDGRRTVSYPKYLMEKHLGRKLDPDLDTVDHIDRDFTNNDINNLRLVPRSQHSKDDTRRVKLIKLKCSMCDKEFERSPRLLRDKSKKGNRGVFCSKQCAGRYARKLQLGLIDKLPVQPYVESEYYRNIKNLAEVSSKFIIKYAINL